MLARLPSGYVISDDPDRLQLDVVADFLAEAYWSAHRPRDVVVRAIENSFALGLYAPGDEQVGFARATTDRATFAYVADVFVLPAHRGRGLGRSLVEALIEHPELVGVERWLLTTADAHGLYAGLGFGPLPDPALMMVRQTTTSPGR